MLKEVPFKYYQALACDVLMFDALRERTLKGAATKSFNSGLKACAEMAMNFWLTTLMIAKALISPIVIKIELSVACVRTKMV